MSTNRKDNKGRVLKQGENQRANGTYMYRYTDIAGRHCVYAKTLNELRVKEKEIQTKIELGVNYKAGNITVGDLVEKYIKTRDDLRISTQANYEGFIETMRNSYIWDMHINDVLSSTVKEYYINMYNDGVPYFKLTGIKIIGHSAFQMAFEDDCVARNPFDVRIPIKSPYTKREGLSKDETKSIMEFIRTDKVCIKYYEIVYILLHTGLRIGELCALTDDDIDFENGTITVNKQIAYDHHSTLYVTEPKTRAAYRTIPLLADTAEMFRRVMDERNAFPVVDGYTNFIFINKEGNVFCGNAMTYGFRIIRERYEKMTGKKIKFSPHILRHTFCSMLIDEGVNIKTVQYVMGHVDTRMTMDVYSHKAMEDAIADLKAKSWLTPKFTPIAINL